MRTDRAIVFLLLCLNPWWGLAGCGGGGSDSSTPSGSSAPAEGIWIGTTTTARTVTGIVLDNGNFWVLYSAPNNGSIIAGGVQGTASSTNGIFSSQDARDFNLEGAGINTATIAGNYLPKQSLTGTVTYPALNQAVAFSGAYDAAYELTPSLARIAGTYSGTAAVVGSTESATVSISQSGTLSGMGSSGCPFTGTVAPRIKGNVYDVVVTFGGGVCSNGNSTVTGIGYFDAGLNRLYSAGVNSTRSNGFIFVGAPSNTQANLASLEVSAGALTPSFDPNITGYALNVGSTVTSVTLTATVPNPGTTVMRLSLPNGQTVVLGSGQPSGPIALNVGVNQILLTVEAPGLNKTYSLIVTRGFNAELVALQLSAGALVPAFSPSQTSYTVDTSFNTDSTLVTATAADPFSAMTINGKPATSGQPFGPIALAVGSNNVITIRVMAANGATKDYHVTVQRTGTASLGSLSVSAGSLSPAFSPTTLAYTVSTGFTTSQTTINAGTVDSTAAVTVNGQGPVQGGGSFGPFPLAVGANTFVILVTSPTTSSKTYTVTITRQSPSSNASLSNLSISPGTLDPTFASQTTNYTVNVGNSVSSVTVIATLADHTAMVTINGVGGSMQTIPLNPAGTSTAISVVVIAQDGVTTQTYLVTVNRVSS